MHCGFRQIRAASPVSGVGGIIPRSVPTSPSGVSRAIPHSIVREQEISDYEGLQFIAMLRYHGMRQRRDSAQREDRAVVEVPGMAKDWCSYEAAPVDRYVW